MTAQAAKVLDLHTGQEAKVRTVYLPEVTTQRLAEQILICARDIREEDGLICGTMSYIPAAFEKAPKIALEAVAKITGTNVVPLDRIIQLKGALAPIHDRPSAFRNDRKRHEK